MKAPVYLIPFDFSPVSEDALQLGIDLAKHNDGSVLMLHFVARKADAKEARDRFAALVGQLPENDRLLIDTRVLVGNIYDNIAMASELINASLIVMGTHGAKGLQKLFGSHALKLVSNTNVPFIITQGGKPEGKIKHIVMPYYFERESVQIANFAAYIARQFDATIHLVGSTPKDEWNKEHTNTNRLVLHKFFSDHSIAHELVNLPLEKSYEKELLDYAESVSADLIAVSYHNQSLLPTMHSFVQELIENDKQIPVLTVNTEDLTITSGYFFIST
jgi:nucleotide-binding universal stress UspA family protein